MRSVSAVVAVKPWSQAKSRLAGLEQISAAEHTALVQAMLIDTCRAVTDTGCSLVVVSDQPGLGELLTRHGLTARVLPDPGDGMNAALRVGAAAASTASGVLAVVSDLPCLDPTGLAAVLDQTGSAAGRWFVPDRSGVGTTMLLARGQELAPAFEGPSAERHRRSGARPLPASPAARLDVDDEASLVDALAHGVGARTAVWAGRQPWLHRGPEGPGGAVHRFLPGPATQRGTGLQ